MVLPKLKFVNAGILKIAFHEFGDHAGWPVVLLHGFPYDAHSFEGVAPILAREGAWVIVPYLRGFGPTTFRSNQSMRSGQQAALAADLLELLDALGLAKAVLAGFDWGGRAACSVAALYPDRVAGLVTQNGYNIVNIDRSSIPLLPEDEARLWYQYYFHSERGRSGLEVHREKLCRLLWETWSPGWRFAPDSFSRTAESFHNPDFVDVVVHSYRHRFGLALGDPAYEEYEARLADRPQIEVPTISLDGRSDGLPFLGHAHACFFGSAYEHRWVANAGHNIPQEHPGAFSQAVLDLYRKDGLP